MAMDTSKLHLPKTVATAVVNKVKETSTIAALSPSSPQIFTDKEYMIFNGAAEADVTAEGQTKSSYEQKLGYVSGKTFKVQTTTRVTSELKWADEDNRFQIIQSIQADQAEAIGRALDYVVYHAVNPKTGGPLTGFDALTARAMQVTAGDDDITNVDNLADQLNETYDINGIAISRTWASRLRKIRVPATGMRYYPEIPLNLQVGTLDGIKAATSATVNGPRPRHPPTCSPSWAISASSNGAWCETSRPRSSPTATPTRPAWTSRPTTRSSTAPRPCSPTRSSNPRRSPCSRPPRKKVPDGRVHQDFIVQKTNRKKHKPAAMDVPARLWNPDGTPFAGCSSTPADGSVTNAMLAGGITADKLAAGVIPTVPKAAYVADPAGDTPTKAEYVALRDALVTAGLMRPKA